MVASPIVLNKYLLQNKHSKPSHISTPFCFHYTWSTSGFGLNSVFARDVTDLSSAMLEVQRTNMAAAHAEQPSRNALEKGIIHEIPLSNYAKSLDSIVRSVILIKYLVLVLILFLFQTKS